MLARRMTVKKLYLLSVGVATVRRDARDRPQRRSIV